MPRPAPRSPRLAYRELSRGDLAAFHRLATDPHIRRFLFDDQVVSREWSARAIERSLRGLEEDGLGLWLLSESGSPGEPIGFAGFWIFEELGPEAELIYAVAPGYAGKGYATEAAAALIAFARAHAGIDAIRASADEPNQASIRVLERLGFEREGEVPGAAGSVVLFRLAAGKPPQVIGTE